ncbi:MAG: peptidylprolyl isomerase, partial [Flavobacteriales bacterium]
DIGGSSISIGDWNEALNNRSDLFDYTNQSSLSNEVWNDMIEEKLLSSDYEDLGITVNQDEFDQIRFGDNLSPYVQRTFYGQDVSEEKKNNWKTTFANMFDNDRNKYVSYSEVITKKRLREKYNNLINRGLYANSLEAKFDDRIAQEKVNIKYVLKKYTDIPDSAISVSDAEVRAYYQRHKDDKEYIQTKSRDLKYVMFSLEPSEDDIKNIESEMSLLVDKWKADSSATFGPEQNDQYKSYSSKLISPSDTAGLSYGAQVFNLPQGTVLNPIEEAGAMKVMKILSKTEKADTTATVRHILLKAKDVEDEAEMATLNARADSIKRKYLAGENWDDLCSRFSEDPGSKSKGGKYENFPKGQMVPAFNDFSFDKSIGSIGAVETSFGVHLIEVLDRRYKVNEVNVGIISRDILPSSETRTAVFEEANNFALLYNSEDAFLDGADTLGYAVVEASRVTPSATTISNLKEPGRLLGWVFKAEEGEISNPQQVEGGFVVAMVTKILESGTPPFENVEELMREAALKDAKGKQYAEIMSSGETLEAVAEAAGSEVKVARNLSLKTSTIAGSGVSAQEPIVVGRAVGIPVGNMSTP